MGGHNVPPEDVRRRYDRSLHNLFDLYIPLVDEWQLFDNSGIECRPVAVCSKGEINVKDLPLYQEIQSKHGH